MAQAKQTGKIKVKCNKCGKEAEVTTAEYYKPGGLRGGCCKTARLDNKLQEVITLNTWSTVSAGKIKTHKPSRDRKPKGSMKG